MRHRSARSERAQGNDSLPGVDAPTLAATLHALGTQLLAGSPHHSRDLFVTCARAQTLLLRSLSSRKRRVRGGACLSARGARQGQWQGALIPTPADIIETRAGGADARIAWISKAGIGAISVPYASARSESVITKVRDGGMPDVLRHRLCRYDD